jgi:hypothetical protein
MANEIAIRTNLKPNQRKRAEAAIENVHLAYYEKGGIRDTVSQLEGQLETASRHVFGLAQYAAQQHPDDLKVAAQLYVELCEYAEQAYKRTHEVENLREALPTWATYKSNVLRGLKAGLNPLEHKSEKVFRSKSMELISRSRNTLAGPEPPDGEARAGPPRMMQEDEVVDMVGTTAIPDTLKQLVAQVVYAAEIVNIRKLDQAEEILREAWQKLGALTDRRKLK